MSTEPKKKPLRQALTLALTKDWSGITDTKEIGVTVSRIINAVVVELAYLAGLPPPTYFPECEAMLQSLLEALLQARLKAPSTEQPLSNTNDFVYPNALIRGHVVDLYEIARALDIASHPLFNAFKKIARCGRGAKPEREDLQEAVRSIMRHLDGVSVAAASNPSAPQPAWSSELPTEEGFYWRDDCLAPIEVYTHDSVRCRSTSGADYRLSDADPACRWLKITKPAIPETV